MKVEEIMVRKIEFIDSTASLFDAIEKMIDKRLRSLVVTPKEESDVYGVITVRDIVFKAIKQNLDLNKTKVYEVANKPVVCVNRVMDIKHAINLMDKFNIARVFVCDNMQIIGIVSLMDILNAFLIMRARGDYGA
ncbi:MAG: CBS domain-containing protein [Thermodesulfovibrionales bacterium]|nr:CBS domain-containing protein [Thermodesulfovibrionales bacterium]